MFVMKKVKGLLSEAKHVEIGNRQVVKEIIRKTSGERKNRKMMAILVSFGLFIVQLFLVSLC